MVGASVPQTFPSETDFGMSISAKYHCNFSFWVRKSFVCEIEPIRSCELVAMFSFTRWPKIMETIRVLINVGEYEKPKVSSKSAEILRLSRPKKNVVLLERVGFYTKSGCCGENL